METSIGWTATRAAGRVYPGFSLNPWWGCLKVSEECANCYAATFAHRLGLDLWGKDTPRRPASEATWRSVEKWNADALRSGIRRKVFCASMADVFEVLDNENGAIMDAGRTRLFELIPQLPGLDFLLLTKRPDQARRLLPTAWMREGLPANVWMGATVGHPRSAWRVDELAAIPARVRFLSCEPLLGPVAEVLAAKFAAPPIDWFIVGGESGGKARPMRLAWARDLVDYGRAHGRAVFVKQLGGRPISDDGEPLRLAHRKGEAIEEWPADLRVQDWPASVAA